MCSARSECDRESPDNPRARRRPRLARRGVSGFRVGLPRPSPRELHVQSKAQERTHGDKDRQDTDSSEGRRDGHRADDVSSDEKLQPKEDRFANLLAIHAIGQLNSLSISQREDESACGDNEPHDDDQDARSIDDLRDGVYRVLEVCIVQGRGRYPLRRSARSGPYSKQLSGRGTLLPCGGLRR
jgi:hypothetical protein